MVLAVRKAVVLAIVVAVVVEKNGQTAFFGPTLERERTFWEPRSRGTAECAGAPGRKKEGF